MECPEGLSYTKEHEWAEDNDGVVTIGITDYAQSELGDIVYVELPEVGSVVKAGESFGVVESVKSVSDLFSPVTGEVVEINEDLQNEPELVNSSPYESGWMIKVQIDDEGELKQLLSDEEYISYVKSLK